MVRDDQNYSSAYTERSDNYTASYILVDGRGVPRDIQRSASRSCLRAELEGSKVLRRRK
jgi:hypothetical protein